MNSFFKLRVKNNSSWFFLHPTSKKIQSRISLTNTYNILHFKIIKRSLYSFFIHSSQLFQRLLTCIDFSDLKYLHVINSNLLYSMHEECFLMGGGDAEVNIIIYIVFAELGMHCGSYKGSFLHRLRDLFLRALKLNLFYKNTIWQLGSILDEICDRNQETDIMQFGIFLFS